MTWGHISFFSGISLLSKLGVLSRQVWLQWCVHLVLSAINSWGGVRIHWLKIHFCSWEIAEVCFKINNPFLVLDKTFKFYPLAKSKSAAYYVNVVFAKLIPWFQAQRFPKPLQISQRKVRHSICMREGPIYL